MGQHKHENELELSIVNWIKSNSYIIHPSYRWQIGVKSAEELNEQQTELLGDLDCKYFKFWKAESFLDALSVVKNMRSYTEVDISEEAENTQKRFYIFTYRTRTDRHEYQVA